MAVQSLEVLLLEQVLVLLLELDPAVEDLELEHEMVLEQQAVLDDGRPPFHASIDAKDQVVESMMLEAAASVELQVQVLQTLALTKETRAEVVYQTQWRMNEQWFPGLELEVLVRRVALKILAG